MLCILFTKNCFVFNSPIYPKCVIQNANASICFWMIELITLILEYGRFRENSKTVCKASGHKELAMIILCQFYSHMLTISGASFTNIYSHIQDCTFYATN